MVDRVARDRRSLDILSVKKEAKLLASAVKDVEVVGRGHADCRSEENRNELCIRTNIKCNIK